MRTQPALLCLCLCFAAATALFDAELEDTLQQAETLIQVGSGVQSAHGPTVNTLKKQALDVITALKQFKTGIEEQAIVDNRNYTLLAEEYERQAKDAMVEMQNLATLFQNSTQKENDLSDHVVSVTQKLSRARQMQQFHEHDDKLWKRMNSNVNTTASRAADLLSNAQILTTWREEMQNLSARIVLPQSATDPVTTIIEKIGALSKLMENAATMERKYSETGNSLLSKVSQIPPLSQSATSASFEKELEATHKDEWIERVNADEDLMATDRLQARLQSVQQQQQTLETSFRQRQLAREQDLNRITQLILDVASTAESWCPHQCSKRGKCILNKCVCNELFEGVDCAGVKMAALPEVQKVAAKTSNSSANNTKFNFAFSFGSSTHAFLASEPLKCVSPFPSLSVAMWVRPARGEATLFSYATPTHDSEFLLWLDAQCESLFVWVNSMSRGDLQGVPVATLRNASLCDDRWHHIAVTWDGRIGESKAYVDGKPAERHWAVFMGERLAPNGRFILGHNQVHTNSEQASSGAFVSDAFVGVMSDVFVVDGVVSAAEAAEIKTEGRYGGSKAFVRWTLNQNGTTSIIQDQGSWGISGAAFDGSWVPLSKKLESCAR